MVRRVRLMSLGEVATKVWVVARDQVDALRAVKTERHVRALHEGAELRALKLPASLPLQRTRLSLHGLAWDLEGELDWRRGTGAPWPVVPSARLATRRADLHGDIRVRWELDRLQWLPGLALREPDLAWRQLESFCSASPLGFGTSWTCAMEVALRVVSVVRAASAAPVPAATQRTVAGLLVASARYIDGHISSGSSHGNHTLVEGLGLLWAGSALSHPAAQAWTQRGLELVQHSALAQILPDGTPAEQSTAYLATVLDALVHASMVATLDEAVWQRMEAAAAFLLAVSGPSGRPFDIGDRDDACVGWGTGQREGLPAGVCTAIGRYRGRSDLQVNTAGATRWAATLTPSQASIKHTATKSHTSTPVQRWCEGGMTQLTFGDDKVLLRHAPLGMPPLFGHGHHDPLALLWRRGDVEILGDSGTGAYAGAPEIRSYLRSQAAHNTWRDDRALPPVATGPFLQDRPYKCVFEEADPVQMSASAWLGGTRQRRAVQASKGRLKVHDRPDAPTTATAWWCVGEGDVTHHNGVVTVHRTEGTLTLVAPAGVHVRLVKGAIGPVEGWRSGSYSEWHASTVVELRGAMPATGWTTELLWEAR